MGPCILLSVGRGGGCPGLPDPLVRMYVVTFTSPPHVLPHPVSVFTGLLACLASQSLLGGMVEQPGCLEWHYCNGEANRGAQNGIDPLHRPPGLQAETELQLWFGDVWSGSCHPYPWTPALLARAGPSLPSPPGC